MHELPRLNELFIEQAKAPALIHAVSFRARQKVRTCALDSSPKPAAAAREGKIQQRGRPQTKIGGAFFSPPSPHLRVSQLHFRQVVDPDVARLVSTRHLKGDTRSIDIWRCVRAK